MTTAVVVMTQGVKKIIRSDLLTSDRRVAKLLTTGSEPKTITEITMATYNDNRKKIERINTLIVAIIGRTSNSARLIMRRENGAKRADGITQYSLTIHGANDTYPLMDHIAQQVGFDPNNCDYTNYTICKMTTITISDALDIIVSYCEKIALLAGGN